MLDIKTHLLDISELTRSKDKIREIYKIVLYHAPKFGMSAIATRNYINNLKNQDNLFCSYHYIIGLDGEIINIIPENELSLHTNILEFDYHSLAIAICYNDKNLSYASITALKKLCNYLIKKYSLDKNYDIIRCYDLINKRSPIFFVDSQYAFYDFKKSLK